MKKTSLLNWSGSLAALALASLTGSAFGQGSPVLTPKWNVSATNRAYLGTTSNWPRGVAINPVTGHVLVPLASTVDPYPPEIHILSGVDGSDIGTLNVTGISGGHAGKFPVDQIGVADDGVIYSATLAVNTPVFQIWRWASESAAPTSAYGPGTAGPVAERIGDSFAVRGAGVKTQIIAAGGPTQINTNVTIFTTTDGLTFVGHQIALPAGVAANEAGRGLAFDGTNDAFYCMAAGSTTVHHIGFDLATGTATLLNNIALPASSLGLSLYSMNGFTIMPTIQDTYAVSPHGFTVFDLTDPTVAVVAAGGNAYFPPPATVDGNATGATAARGNLVVGLSTHNGIVALTLGTVTNAPAIVVQPQDYTSFPGTPSTNATFTVAMSGSAPFYYQWYRNGTAIPNATAKSLTITNVQSANVGQYSVVVTNIKAGVTSSVAMLNLATTGYPAAVAADHPIAYWRLDETGGSVVRDLWGGYNATARNMTQGVPGCSLLDSNRAAGFDSSVSVSEAIVPYNTAMDFTNMTATFTLEGWVQFNKTENRCQRLFGNLDYAVSNTGSGYGFGVANSHALRFTTYGVQDFDLELGVENSFIPGNWYYLAGVSDGSGNFIFYVNGQQVGSIAYNADPITSTKPMMLGNDPYNFDWMNGRLDELAIYPTALTPDRILAHYEARYSPSTPPMFRVQPVGVTNYTGLYATFNCVVEGGGSSFSYQWKKDGQDLPYQNSYTLTVGPLDNTSAGNYTVQVSGATTVSSAAAHLAVLPAPTAIDVSSNLVLHLKFDGDFVDYSGRGNSGTAVGAPTFVSDGKIGQAAHFSTIFGSSIFNYATLGVRPDLAFSSNVNFSVSYWVRLPYGAQPGDIPFIGNAIGAGSSPGYFFGPGYVNGAWRWTLKNADGTGSTVRSAGEANSINDGNWHNVISTFNRQGNATTYVDGLLTSTVAISGIGDLDTGNAVVVGQDPTGAYDDGASDDVEFDLDDLGVWRRELTALEAGQIYVVGAYSGANFVSAPVRMAVSNAGQIQLIWAGGLLQSADQVNGTYTDVANATSPYTVSPAAAKKFYRIRQ
jgi:hypothetical protein